MPCLLNCSKAGFKPCTRFNVKDTNARARTVQWGQNQSSKCFTKAKGKKQLASYTIQTKQNYPVIFLKCKIENLCCLNVCKGRRQKTERTAVKLLFGAIKGSQSADAPPRKPVGASGTSVSSLQLYFVTSHSSSRILQSFIKSLIVHL